MAGQVRVDNNRILKPGTIVPCQASILVDPQDAFVSRGAKKLEKALQDFDVDVKGCACLDAGASTGGFSDILLRAGARQIIAVDVGYGQLAWNLRRNPKIKVLERTNIRYLKAEEIPAPVDIITADLSFISLKKVIDNLMRLSKEEAILLLLVKPQFEAERRDVGKGGIVRRPEVQKRVLETLISCFIDKGLVLKGVTHSPILGADGNIEFFLYLKKKAHQLNEPENKDPGAKDVEEKAGVSVSGRYSDEEIKELSDKAVELAYKELKTC